MPDFETKPWSTISAFVVENILPALLIVLVALIALRLARIFVHGIVQALMDRESTEGTAQELSAVERMPGAQPDGPLVIVGDPDAWQARWGLFAELRPLATLVFHECRLSDYRTLSRSRELPPLLVRSAEEGERVIAVDRDGRARRARLA